MRARWPSRATAARFLHRLPERPIFAAMKLVERELGHTMSPRYRLPPVFDHPPFNIGATTMGYGLGPAFRFAFNVKGPSPPLR